MNRSTKAELSWYTGVSLMEAINNVPDIPVRSFHQLCNMPLRLVVNEAFHMKNGVGTVAFACVRAGVLRKGQELVVANTNVCYALIHVSVRTHLICAVLTIVRCASRQSFANDNTATAISICRAR